VGNRTVLVQGTRVKKLRKLAREKQQTTENGLKESLFLKKIIRNLGQVI